MLSTRDYISLGIQAESQAEIFAAYEFYRKAFELIIEEGDDLKLELAAAVGSAHINCHLFLWQAGLIDTSELPIYHKLLLSTLSLLGFIANQKKAIATPSLYLADIISTMKSGVKTWSSKYTTLKVMVKIYDKGEEEKARREFDYCNTLYRANDNYTFVMNGYHPDEDRFSIKIFPGLVGKEIRIRLKLPDDQQRFFGTYDTSGRPFQSEESVKANINAYEKFISNFADAKKRRSITIERQTNWLYPRTPIGICSINASERPCNFFIGFKGDTLAEIFSSEIVTFEGKVYLLELALDALVGLWAVLQKQTCITESKAVMHYDYLSRFEELADHFRLPQQPMRSILKFIDDEFQEGGKCIYVHGDCKPANMVVPWAHEDHSLDEYLESNVNKLFKDIPGGQAMHWPEIPLSFSNPGGLHVRECRIPLNSAYILPCVIDMESVCLAPPEHDVVRLVEGSPGLVCNNTRKELMQRVNLRLNDLQTRTGINSLANKIDQTSYDCVRFIFILDQLRRCVERGGTYLIGRWKFGPFTFLNQLEDILSSSSRFTISESKHIREILQYLRGLFFK